MSAGWHRSSVRESLCFALRTPVAAVSSVAPKLPPSLPTPRLHQWRGFLVCGDLSSFTATSQKCRSCPYSLVSVFYFFFCLTWVCGEFLAFWGVWGLLPAFSRCSVGVVPHVDMLLMYLWGGRWSPRFTPLPSWRSLSRPCSWLQVVYHERQTNKGNGFLWLLSAPVRLIKVAIFVVSVMQFNYENEMLL